MGPLLDILLAPFTGPYYGLKFVLNALRQQVESERGNEEQSLREELTALNMRIELGQISEQDFEAKEAVILERLRAFDEDAEPDPGAEPDAS